MPDTYTVLQEKRQAFNSFAATILPTGVLKHRDLSFSDMARLISDKTARRMFCQLAITMLDANVAHYQADAARLRTRDRNRVVVVASTLIVAGLVQYFQGSAAALVTVAGWYGFAGIVAARLTYEARAQNVEVGGRAETIERWEIDHKALRKILTTLGEDNPEAKQLGVRAEISESPVRNA